MSEHEWADERGWRWRVVGITGETREIFEELLCRPGIDDGFQLVGREYAPATAEMMRLAAEGTALRALLVRQAEALRDRLEEAEPLSGDPRAPMPAWVASVQSVLNDPWTLSAIAWLEEERRRAVREAPEGIEAAGRELDMNSIGYDAGRNHAHVLRQKLKSLNLK